jgi:hypothetical protein
VEVRGWVGEPIPLPDTLDISALDGLGSPGQCA